MNFTRNNMHGELYSIQFDMQARIKLIVCNEDDVITFAARKVDSDWYYQYLRHIEYIESARITDYVFSDWILAESLGQVLKAMENLNAFIPDTFAPNQFK